MNTLFKTVTNSVSNRPQKADVVALPGHGHASRLFIEDLCVKMFIGVLPQEKRRKQRILVSVDLTVQPNEAWREDDLKDVVSYAGIVALVEKMAASGHINLLETFAEMIIEESLANKRVLEATVKINKPDIFRNARGAGVKITRRNRHHHLSSNS